MFQRKMKNVAPKIKPRVFRLLILMSAFQFLLLTVHAQTNDARDTAPPPLKIISKDEAKQLEAETDIKKRTKLTLDLMEIRLKKAEAFNAAEQYAEMFGELGGFHALMDKILDFLNRRDNGKILSNFKRVELSLRAFLPRLETIRRDLPPAYEFYVRDLAKNVRAARSKAIEPFFSETIIKDNDE